MSGDEFTAISLEINQGIAVLTLKRPESLNSFTVVMHKEVQTALDRIEGDPEIRVMVLTGAGRGFCAGQDLGDDAVKPSDGPVDLGHAVETYYNPLVLRLRRLPIPVICAVNGVAAGAGANIAFACDIVIAGKSASFIQPFCHIGLIPDSGGTFVLPRLVGLPRAMGLALLGEKVSAERAAEWGMIWQAVEDDQLMDTVMGLAGRLSRAATKGLGMTKKLLHASLENDLETQLALERDTMRELGFSEDYKEGVDAFLEKRKPNFKGR